MDQVQRALALSARFSIMKADFANSITITAWTVAQSIARRTHRSPYEHYDMLIARWQREKPREPGMIGEKEHAR